MKLWGGRFERKPDERADLFHSSISFDQRLYKYDILGSIVHAQMLGKQGIIPQSDVDAIVTGLEEILADIEGGSLAIDPTAEDIHSFVEAELTKHIGEAGRRLHTARSRNDQIALDMRMYIKDEIDALDALLQELLTLLLMLAKKHEKTVMPGFTHMQKAQPITLDLHLTAYSQMFRRDSERLHDCRMRVDVMPLGSCALAGTTHPIDRDFVCKRLGFAKLTENTIDAVSDRDYCLEFVSCLSIVMMHLSRFCEELIIWSTEAFGFVEISDAFTTGSSIMPQKKNPDLAELIRGKAGRVYGSLMSLLTTMKGLPLAYNTDMQEDKEAFFDAADTVKACLSIFIAMLAETTFREDSMLESARSGYTNATLAADWLVKRGVAFRDAHEIVGKLVRLALDKGVSLEKLTLDDFKSISDVFDDTIFEDIRI